MKILIPITGFGSAGGFRVLSELANNWIKEGNSVVFLVDSRSPKPYFPTSATIITYDVNGVTVNRSVNLGEAKFKRSGNGAGIYFGMWKALNQIGSFYDVILANHSLTAFPVALSNSGAQKFYYVQAYEPEYYFLMSGLKAKVLKVLASLSYRLPLKQVANAPIYVGYKSIKANSWMPPGIDPDIFFRRPTEPTFSDTSSCTIGVIGRHEPTKGTQYVLNAFESLVADDPLIKLKVAFGNLPTGWNHPQAETVIPRNDSELADFYRGVDILVAPGTVQLGACHYPVLEAMACGTPVITTGYLPADDSNSFIVPVHNSAAIANAVNKIRRMKSIDRSKMLDKANKDIKPFFWQNVAKSFLQVMKY